MGELDADVVVIGAGLAGLSAARSLVAGGAGGARARGARSGRWAHAQHAIGEEKVVEIGGQWVGPGQDRVLAVIGELGLETFDT